VRREAGSILAETLGRHATTPGAATMHRLFSPLRLALPAAGVLALHACKLEPVDPRAQIHVPGFDDAAAGAHPAPSASPASGRLPSPALPAPSDSAAVPPPSTPSSPAAPPAAPLPPAPPALIALRADALALLTGTSTLLRAELSPPAADVALDWTASCGALVPAADTRSARFFAPRTEARCRVTVTLADRAYLLDLDVTASLEDLP
jgi:hypothetical protein